MLDSSMLTEEDLLAALAEEDIVEFVDCVVDTDYEIGTTYPYVIRKKSNNHIVGESDDGRGYIKCKLNGRTYRKHVIVANQFIPNPNNLTCIDHINRNRSDYHIENLRWCTSRENNMNKTSNLNVELEYFDEIPDDTFEVTSYGEYEFENLYYSESNDRFYFWNGVQYRALSIIYVRGAATVKCWTKNNKRVNIYYAKFKKLYNLVQ